MQQLLQPGQTLAGSCMQHASVTKMLDDGLLQKQQTGKTKTLLFITGKEKVAAYLSNHFGINDLDEYISTLESNEQSRAANIAVSGNSKLQTVKTFKGFLVNSYNAINCTLNGRPFQINPAAGSYTFIHDYETFIPDAAVTIIGIENSENFSHIDKQQYLFEGLQPLFVSRYPQSNHLVKWLSGIPNQYLHFGDLDFSGISIYHSEYKKYLGERATFFLPEDIVMRLEKYGNKDLFNKQYNPLVNYAADEQNIQELLRLIFKYKKVLEQEIFMLPQ
ncbi:hypothetical protein [Ferruginibacter profundus]